MTQQTEVKLFTNRGTSQARTLSNDDDGDFISLLKDCLINGYNTQTPSSITFDAPSGVATATYATAHGYLPYQVLEVSGANETEYNGEHRIHSVPTLTTLTFKPLSAPSGAATGTLSSKLAPAGWVIEEEDAATHRIALRSGNADRTKHTFVVDNYLSSRYSTNTYARWAYIDIVQDDRFRSLDDYDATIYTAHWPANHNYCDMSRRFWTLIADDRFLYWHIYYAIADLSACYVLGDFLPENPADEMATLINSAGVRTGTAFPDPSRPFRDMNNDVQCQWHISTAGEMVYNNIGKPGYTETLFAPGPSSGLPIPAQLDLIGTSYSDAYSQFYGGFGKMFDYPNPVNGGLVILYNPIMIVDKHGGGAYYHGLRGYLPGAVETLNGTGRSTAFDRDGKVLLGARGFEDTPLYFMAYNSYYGIPTVLQDCCWLISLANWRGQRSE